MSAAQHTRGPWSVVEYTASDAIVVHADHQPDGEICLVSRQDPQSEGGRSKDIELANARLIAAAPELLAVANMIVSFARNTRENAESTNLLFSAADAARAAIAKAEGTK